MWFWILIFVLVALILSKPSTTTTTSGNGNAGHGVGLGSSSGNEHSDEKTQELIIEGTVATLLSVSTGNPGPLIGFAVGTILDFLNPAQDQEAQQRAQMTEVLNQSIDELKNVVNVVSNLDSQITTIEAQLTSQINEAVFLGEVTTIAKDCVSDIVATQSSLLSNLAQASDDLLNREDHAVDGTTAGHLLDLMSHIRTAFGAHLLEMHTTLVAPVPGSPGLLLNTQTYFASVVSQYNGFVVPTLATGLPRFITNRYLNPVWQVYNYYYALQVLAATMFLEASNCDAVTGQRLSNFTLSRNLTRIIGVQPPATSSASSLLGRLAIQLTNMPSTKPFASDDTVLDMFYQPNGLGQNLIWGNELLLQNNSALLFKANFADAFTACAQLGTAGAIAGQTSNGSGPTWLGGFSGWTLATRTAIFNLFHRSDKAPWMSNAADKIAVCKQLNIIRNASKGNKIWVFDDTSLNPKNVALLFDLESGQFVTTFNVTDLNYVLPIRFFSN